MIESTRDTERPVICLILRNENDSTGMDLLDQFSTEISKLEKELDTKELDASFLFTGIEDFNRGNLGNYNGPVDVKQIHPSPHYELLNSSVHVMLIFSRHGR